MNKKTGRKAVKAILIFFITLLVSFFFFSLYSYLANWHRWYAEGSWGLFHPFEFYFTGFGAYPALIFAFLFASFSASLYFAYHYHS